MSTNAINQIGIDIEPGFYTIVYPNGEHRTLQVKMPKDGYFAGKKIIGFLSGPENTRHYRFFGTLSNGQLYFWGKFSSTVPDIKLQRIRRAVEIIASRPDEAGTAYAMNSGRCYVCGRLLTHPESIVTGIGPECGKRKSARAEKTLAIA